MEESLIVDELIPKLNISQKVSSKCAVLSPSKRCGPKPKRIFLCKTTFTIPNSEPLKWNLWKFYLCLSDMRERLKLAPRCDPRQIKWNSCCDLPPTKYKTHIVLWVRWFFSGFLNKSLSSQEWVTCRALDTLQTISASRKIKKKEENGRGKWKSCEHRSSHRFFSKPWVSSTV